MDDLNIKTNKVNNSFFTGPKIIFAILGLVILAEVIYAVKALNVPTIVSVQQTTTTSAQTEIPGRISLSAPKTSYKVADLIPVSIAIDIGPKEISGADVIVSFDPNVLEVVPNGITKGRIFNEYPLLAQDAKKGKVSVSGISTLKNVFSGTGQFATINFKAKAPGKTSLVVNFQKGSTTESNLVEAASAKNILETVTNLDLEVQ